MNEFDDKAAGWDKNHMHIERSEAVAKKLMEMIDIKPGMCAMEYGAGTGITSFILSDYCSEITLMDDSLEMVKVLNLKIADSNKTNLTPLQFNLELNDYTGRKFDLIFNQMVLHHIASTEKIIKKFYDLLNTNGFLAIADLYSEDGSFHGEGFSGHNGFNISDLKQKLENAGFHDIREEQCYAVKKEVNNQMRSFPVFLMTGRK